MFEPAQIIIKEGAQVWHTIFQHGDAVDAHAPSKALIFIGVNAAIAQNIGVHHAATQNLQPAVPLANQQLAAFSFALHIHFHRGFGERKIGSAEAQVHLFYLKKGFAKGFQNALEVAHVGRLINHQPLHLVEHGGVSLVAVRAIGAPGAHHANGRGLAGHGAHLHGGSVGAQHLAVAFHIGRQIKGVVVLAGGVIQRNVQRREVVKIRLHIWAFGNGKTHIRENRCDLVNHLADGVNAASALGRRAHRQGDVQSFRC